MDHWISTIPPVTRAWAIGAVLLSVAVQCKLVVPLQLYYAPKLVMQGQLWRLLTTFLFFGQLSLDLVFHLFFFLRYSRMLEETSYANRRADYLWLLIVCATALVLVSPFFGLPFLSSSLANTLVFLWAKRNPLTRLSLFGLVVIRAPYLPHALVGLTWLMTGSFKAALTDVLGIAIGQLFWFGSSWWPREMASGGYNVFKTPKFLTWVVQ